VYVESFRSNWTFGNKNNHGNNNNKSCQILHGYIFSLLGNYHLVDYTSLNILQALSLLPAYRPTLNTKLYPFIQTITHRDAVLGYFGLPIQSHSQSTIANFHLAFFHKGKFFSSQLI